jgi:hypothetical protein
MAMMKNDTGNETPVKRGRGRPCLEGSHESSPIISARVPPAIFAAMEQESERRGVKPAILIREALALLLKQAEQRLAA